MSVQLWEAAEEAERERAEACAALAQSRRWHREALDDYLRVLADRADGKAPLRIRVARGMCYRCATSASERRRALLRCEHDAQPP